MRRLILSDIHSNREALEAVLAHAEGKYDECLCLGDIVGYGPDPSPCIALLKPRLTAVIRGNHDRAVAGLDSMEDFNRFAKEAALINMEHITADDLAWLRELPAGPLPYAGASLAHGSPFAEDDYIVQHDEAQRVWAHGVGPLCFIGHTHLQGGFERRAGTVLRILKPAAQQFTVTFQLKPEVPMILNPGSVGQPRDGDPRAAYATWDDEACTVELIRVRYDVPRTQKRMTELGLPELLIDRLAFGR